MAIPTRKRIFITGGAGFVGSAVIDELLAGDFEIMALVNRDELKVQSPRLNYVRGGLFDDRALDTGLAGCDAAIHLVGIIAEKPRAGITFTRMHLEATGKMIAAAKRAGVKRFIHMSALGARADAVSNYHKTKFKAEQALRESGLDWTIFRPSLIHGPGGEFLTMEAAWARGRKPPFVFMPYFGGGLLGRRRPALVQPVYVKDVARAFVRAIDRPQTIRQTYCIGGADQLSWPQMHHVASEIFAGKRKAALGVPGWYAALLTYIVPGKLLPFTRDQVIMGQEDSVCDMSQFTNDLGWTPGGFGQTLREYAAEVK
ncbi:MAG TPA: NAD(P)H-binding protein [Tepidisphaeraceae bacterium]|jgi:NADH dehydrogenase|nr:NAD(P)H-binding protein [Tepidisphaeraceae bacterium]